MFLSLRWVLVTAGMLTWTGCSKPYESVALVPGITVETLAADVAAMTDARVEVDDQVNDGKRPPYHFQRISVAAIDIFGVHQRMTANFFNERLMQVIVCPLNPVDLERSRVELAAMHDVEVSAIESSVESGPLVIREVMGERTSCLFVGVSNVLREQKDVTSEYW
jgi:hypothetical protein